LLSYIAVWQGGLSFHGGVVGGALAAYFFFRKHGVPFIEVADSMVPGLSLGIILVRIGNYMNGDILGYKWDDPWAMNFPYDQYHTDHAQVILRHPTEIYGMLVGVICLLAGFIMWIETYEHHKYRIGTAFFGFIITYSLARSLFEDPFRAVPLFWKVVDPTTAGYGLFTESQLLGMVLIIVGIFGLLTLKPWEDYVDSHGHLQPGQSRQVRRAQERKVRRD
jgi:phosphatidylglycerol:prolipoprotein diacylglycerol transferase